MRPLGPEEDLQGLGEEKLSYVRFIIHEVKEMARDIKEPPDLWKLEDYLTRRRKAIDSTYDYRYSQLFHYPLPNSQESAKGPPGSPSVRARVSVWERSDCRY